MSHPYRSEDQQLNDLFTRGFELAWFIHLNRDISLKVASSAYMRLETIVNRRQHHLKYTDPNRRTRFIPTREQTYQQLVLQCSSELQAEDLNSNHTLDEDTMLAYFYSYIASSLFNMNSFRANAVIARLLLHLPVEQVRSIYEKLRPNFRDTDDSEYSREKQALYVALNERFAGKIVAVTLERNEKSFAPHDNPGELLRLAGECWGRFAPWREACLLADQATNLTQLEKVLESESDQAERDRMHIVMHCLQKFVQLVLGDAPSMLIPRFILTTSADGDPGGSLKRRLTPPELGLI